MTKDEIVALIDEAQRLRKTHAFDLEMHFDHFTFEHLGERNVGLLEYVQAIMPLWERRAYEILGEKTESVVDWIESLVETVNRDQAPSQVDLLSSLILLNSLKPKYWNSPEPYPHKDLLISGLYLSDAAMRYKRDKPAETWHLISTASLYLGHALRRNEAESRKVAASKKNKTRDIRYSRISVEAIHSLWRKKKKPKTLKSAISQIVAEASASPDLQRALHSACLEYYGNTKFDAFESLIKLLEEWCHPATEYPGMVLAIEHLMDLTPREVQESFFEDFSNGKDLDGLPTNAAKIVIRHFYPGDELFTFTGKRTPKKDATD